MTFSHLAFRSFMRFWKSNLLVIIGAAISTMVLTGTLIVGDSMRFSLEQSTELRLGKIEQVFSGNDRYFRSDIARELNQQLGIEVSALLQQRGIASSQGGKFKLNNIQVLGIDRYFSSLASGAERLNIPENNEAYISENLAKRLNLKSGDSFLLRVEKASLVPKNAPFVSSTDNYISLRLKVDKILSNDQLGRFNLSISQTAPYNIFVSNSFLNDKLDWKGKANTLLFSSGKAKNEIYGAIENLWTLEDNALTISSVNDQQNLEVTSQRVFIDSITAFKIKGILPEAKEILTYMANAITLKGKSTPYSFISAGPFLRSLKDNEILINTWLAEDLDAAIGDALDVTYFSIGPLRKLIEKKHQFIIKDIVPMEGQYAEQKLMPDLPGLSDAGSCREWEAGIPISLDAIRDKDEAYWNKYRGTPKAFINYDTGKKLWQNRFGVCTAIWLPQKPSDAAEIERQLSSTISPDDLGFTIKSVKDDGLQAARGGVDFSQLFMGLSFFLLVAAIILMSLLFNLHLEKRVSEIGTLKAIGFTSGMIKKVFLLEGIFIAIPGLLIGISLAILYNKLVFMALDSVWQEIVLTSILKETILPVTLLNGGVVSMIIIGLTIWRNTIKKLASTSSELQRKLRKRASQKLLFLTKVVSILLLLIASGLIIYDATAVNSLNTGIYFTVGALLLISFLFVASTRIGRNVPNKWFDRRALMVNNISRGRKRSIRIILLFALGTFVTMSTGLNQKDLQKNAYEKSSGTGGFQFYMESTIPILNDLNDLETRTNMGIDRPMKFLQLRKNEGDDASCLNLNRVTSPRILSVRSDQLENRFTFVTQTPDLNLENPWSSLKKRLPGNVIPAILDQTVIQWGLGKSVGDTLIYKDELGQEMYLKIIGGLANSIFQGNVIIDEKLFLDHFPSSSGSHVFLVEEESDELEDSKAMLTRTFRNEGLEIEVASDRLAKFNQIENTYLSIFLLLGGLALILGTIGLGISLARNLLDRSKEIGLLGAIGFRKNQIFSMITMEYLVLLSIGTLIGTISAFIATLPSFISGINQNSWQSALILIAAIMINGFIWIFIISKSFLRKKLISAIRAE